MAAATWAGPRRIAHRGGGTLAPENTLAAMREGLARGYRAVEFDVMLTSDGVPVLMHDPDFGRTIAGTGGVATTSWAELSTRDAGSWFGVAQTREPVPRYEDVAAFCRANDVWMNVEIKPAPGFEAATGRVVGAATVALLADRAAVDVLFSSFSIEALAAARSAAPGVPRGLLVEGVGPSTVALARALGCVSVHADHERLDAATIERLHDAGFAVLAYTVDDPHRVDELVVAGIDAIVTNRLDRIAFA